MFFFSIRQRLEFKHPQPFLRTREFFWQSISTWSIQLVTRPLPRPKKPKRTSTNGTAESTPDLMANVQALALLLADVEFRFPFIHSKWDNSVNYSFDLMKFQFLKSIRFRSWTNETLFHFIFLFLFIYLFIRCDTVMVTVHSDDKGLVLLPNVGSVQVNDWSFKKVISQINNIYLKNQLNKIKGDHRSLRYLCERYRGGEI